MKTILFKQDSIVKLLLITSMVFTLFSCKKTAAQCEEWEVTDEKFGNGGCIDLSCSGSRTLLLIFCGDDLKNAKAGNTITLSEDPCCKKTRTFNHFVKKI